MLCWNFEFPLTARRRCVHVGYSDLKTAETLLIFSRGRSSAHSAERSPHQDNTCINRENTFLS